MQKIVGKATGIKFDPAQAHEGQWEAAKKLITLSATSAFSVSNAFHEAFHAVYDQYLTPAQRAILYKAFRDGSVKRQLRELLKDSPDAWRQAQDNPHELAAYAFQFWHSGELKIGPQVSNVFTKILELLAKVSDWLRDQPNAQELLQQIADGAFADGGPSPAELALAKASRPLARVREVTKSAFQLLDKLYDAALYPFDRRMRDMGNPHIDWIAKRFYTQVGEARGARGMVQEIPAQMKARLNALDKIAREHPGLKATLAEIAAGGDKAATDKAATAKIRALLEATHKYMKDAGVDLGHEADYLPMSWDGAKIGAKASEFIAMLKRHQTELDELNAALKQKHGANFKELTPERIQKMMAQRGTATGEFVGSAYDEHGAPQADFTLNRVFGFLKNEDRAPFIKDDIYGGLVRYIKQAVRRAEWTRRFGENGEQLEARLAQAREFGMTPEQEKLVRDYKDAAFGARLHDMNPTVRKILATAQVYQNYRVLGLSLLSNIIDPMGVAVRSGEWSDAFDAYKLALGRMTKKGRAKTADLEAMAETIGALESAGVADSLHELYGGVNIEGDLRKANDALFKYNGMNGLTRSVRLAALAAGTRFVARHAARSEKDSARHLAELGLTREDVKTSADGRLAVLPEDFAALGMDADAAEAASDKVQRGLNRFVDEAAMRPNAGERTAWGALPELAPLYHLKQYVFSFNHVINRKLEHELFEHGNITPYMMAAAYIPIMASSSMARDLIYNGGTLPATNGFWHYLNSGFSRSGLAGTGQLTGNVADAAMGSVNALGQVAGPTASQALDFVSAIANPHNTAQFAKFARESLPLGSILEHL